MRTSLALLILLLVGAACAGTPPGTEVRSWGTMREVLRLGMTEGRVELGQLGERVSVGVGAMAGLEGEVTILDGRVLVARGAQSAAAAPPVRDAAVGDSAALLVVAEVGAWEEVPLVDCGSYEVLEAAIAAQLRARSLDPTEPQPVRIRGRAAHLALHVIAGACPIADPGGPRPWRFAGPVGAVELVGFYVEGAAGRWTHHTRSSHLHAVAEGLMGHLDEVTLEDAVLYLPVRR